MLRGEKKPKQLHFCVVFPVLTLLGVLNPEPVCGLNLPKGRCFMRPRWWDGTVSV